MSRPTGAPQKFLGIQCLRALAAFAVVISHLLLFEQKYETGAAIAPAAVEYGMSGVDLFFVISGFIIATVTAGRFARSGEAGQFLRQRCIRIYPIYWVYCAAVLAVFLVDPTIVNSSHGRPDVLRSFLLLPQHNLPLLLVAWTLVYKMFFYLVFSLAVRWLKESQLAPALLVWAAVIVAGNRLIGTMDDAFLGPFLGLFFSPLILEFIAGCFVALSVRRLRAGSAVACIVLGLAGFAGGSVALAQLGMPFPLGWGRVLIYGTSSTFLVAGVLGVEQAGYRRFPRPVVMLGDASYSLYLSHILVLAVVGHVWARMLAGTSPVNHAAALCLAVGLALVWGLLSFRFIETPLLIRMRNWTRARPASAPAVASLPGLSVGGE